MMLYINALFTIKNTDSDYFVCDYDMEKSRYFIPNSAKILKESKRVKSL